MKTDNKQSGSSGEDESNGTSGLLGANDLDYTMEPDLSVAVNVTHKNHSFQSNSYTSAQRAVCILNSGADYIDTRSSYLSIKLDNSPLGGVVARSPRRYFGMDGSILNIFKTVTISTKSGDEISRITDCNHLNAALNGYRFSRDWELTVGSQIGLGKSFKGDADGDGGDLSNNVYIIPLYLLSDFFAYGRLIPALLMSGLRIEIEWALPEEAFMLTDAGTWAVGITQVPVPPPSSAGLTGAYGVSNLHVGLKSVTLTDATQRALNEQSAVNGLEIMYCDWDRTQARFSDVSTQEGTVEVRKACSRALKAFVRVRDIDKDNTYAYDSFASSGRFDVAEYQFQLGSLYFPQQPLRSADRARPTDILREAYHHTLETCGKNHPNSDRPARSCTDHHSHLSGGPDIWRVPRGAYDGAPHGGHPSYHINDSFYGNASNSEINSALLESGCIYDENEQTAFADMGTFGCLSTTLGVSLERSSLFNLAGVPINNSRALRLNIKWGGKLLVNQPAYPQDTFDLTFPTVDKARIVDVYLKYVKMARIFLNNVEIEQ